MAVKGRGRQMTEAAPEVVDRETWEQARAALLTDEKAETRARDKVSASRRRLPMTPVANYVFEGADGPVALADMFEGRSQLIVQNFMFDPEWDDGCPSCSNLADSVPHLAHLWAHDITYARISRAPYPKLAAYKDRMGWSAPWYSSFTNTYNQDFGWTKEGGEAPGVSVYLRKGDEVFLTYSTQGRGVEPLSGLVGYLDITPYGRQEEWEDSPDGWPQLPTYAVSKRHDEY
jgi:predicted dithiol-disulfide oxidoreductase (DUF899 family)